MRPALFAKVLIACIAVLALRSQDCFARNRAPAAPAANADEKDKRSFEVDGWGTNDKQAREAALVEATDRVLAYLHRYNPPIEWHEANTRAYVEEHLAGGAWLQAREKGEQFVVTHDGEQVRCELHVTIPETDFQDMLHLDRQYRAQNRQLNLFKVLAGLVVAFGASALYFRVNHATKGSHSTMLRVGVVGALGVLGAGWWLFT